jgi:hypothetical protein
MVESSFLQESVKSCFSAHTSLVALCTRIKARGLFAPLAELVKIKQKTVKYSPADKLWHVFVAVLAGAHGLVEINERVRKDAGLQAVCGPLGCAEQSVVQDTLDACTAENVRQAEEAMQLIYRQHGQGCRHDYGARLQLVDIDLTGRPCGKKAAFATKGYFAGERGRSGRQIGYVVATDYKETLVERVYDGQETLTQALPELVAAAEKRLGLDEEKRQRTLLRIDAGGGSVDALNALLARGYQIHGKDYAAARVNKLLAGVSEWISDPQDSGRQIGWLTEAAASYVRAVKRIAVRCRKRNGQWAQGVIISTLSPEEVLVLTGQPAESVQDAQAVLLAYVYFYDQRGGGVEITIKEDKQGLGSKGRNKKKIEAQQMVVQLELLAHNVLVWLRQELAQHCPFVAKLGIKRWVRDLLVLNGHLRFDHAGHLSCLTFLPTDHRTSQLAQAFTNLLAPLHIIVISGKT